MATEEQVRDLAYAIWEQEGRPEGKHVEHYFRAKQILEEQEVVQARVTELAPPPGQRRSTRRKKSREGPGPEWSPGAAV